MASATVTIHKAFENLQSSISLEHRHHFTSTKLEDVWNAVQEIEATQRKRHLAQNLRRIEPLLEALEKYAKVIEILCNGTQYLSFIWVSHPSLAIHFAEIAMS
jgi:5'-deoxynucleotidase YfbR-like HD superfamily hydrolase